MASADSRLAAVVRLVACVTVLATCDAWAGTVLIAGGGRTVAEAELALATLVVPKAVSFAEPPRVVASAELEGLNPGFFIVLLAHCADAERAAAVLDVVRAFNPGAYAKRVKPAAPASACPALESSPGLRGGPRVTRQAVRKGVEAVQWAIKNDDGGADRCRASVRIEVQRKGRALDQRDEEASCQRGGADDLGSSRTPSASLATVGDVTFVVLELDEWVADHGSRTGTLLAFCPDGIREVRALPWTTGAATVELVEVVPQPDAMNPHFRVSEGGEAAGPVLRFDARRCAVEPVP